MAASTTANSAGFTSVSTSVALHDFNYAFLKSVEFTQSTYFRGQLWVSYYSDAGNGAMMLSCRLDNNSRNSEAASFKLYNLAQRSATGDKAPAISGYNGRLYIVWKDKNEYLWMKRCSGATTIPSTSTQLGRVDSWQEYFKTRKAPILTTYQGSLYVTFVDADSGTIKISKYTESQNGAAKWTYPSVSTYQALSPPAFSVMNDQLYIFWLDGALNCGKVRASDCVITEGKTITLTANLGVMTGVTVASRVDKEWMFISNDRRELWSASDTNLTFPKWVNLTDENPNPVTDVQPGAAVVPGNPTPTDDLSWDVYVVWKDLYKRDSRPTPAATNEVPLRESFLLVS